jgi:hypothetical protein
MDDEFMITGNKKKAEKKDYDKNDVSNCISGFSKFFISTNEECIPNKENLIELSLTGEVDKNYIRPTIWKLFLNVLPLDIPLSEWVAKVVSQRAEFKIKLKNLHGLKKFSGDPLGGSQSVILYLIHLL